MNNQLRDHQGGDIVLEAAHLAQGVIRAESGGTDRVTLIDHGHTSVVAVVDQHVVLKFSRDRYSALRNEFELIVLDELGSLKTCDIPVGLGRDSQSSWTALGFLAGKSMTYSQLRGMPVSAQKALGATIGRFAHGLHTTLDKDVVHAKRRELKLDQLDEAPWPLHFEQTVRDGSFRSERQHATALRIYDDWRAEFLKQSDVVTVHDDLHADNLLLHDDALVGVLDFGEVTVGSPEQELRHCFWISETVGEAAITTYEAVSGTQINNDLVRLWSVMQELAAYSEYSQKQNYQHRSFLRAQSGLELLLPDIDWDSGRDRRS